MRAMSTKRYLIALFAAVLCICAVAVRIWWVNAHAVQLPVERYDEGQWLEIGAAFNYSNEEKMDGYAFRVNSVEVMTPNEYLRKYGKDDVRKVDRGNERTILAVNLTMRNSDNTEGGIKSYLWKVVPASRSTMYSPDNELWSHAVKNTESLSMFSVVPGTEVTTVVPFRGLTDNDYGGSWSDMKREPIKDSRFEFVLTNLPVRKLIDMEARG